MDPRYQAVGPTVAQARLAWDGSNVGGLPMRLRPVARIPSSAGAVSIHMRTSESADTLTGHPTEAIQPGTSPRFSIHMRTSESADTLTGHPTEAIQPGTSPRYRVMVANAAWDSGLRLGAPLSADDRRVVARGARSEAKGRAGRSDRSEPRWSVDPPNRSDRR